MNGSGGEGEDTVVLTRTAILITKFCPKPFSCIISFNPQNSPITNTPFTDEKTEMTESLRDLFKSSQLAGGRELLRVELQSSL